MASLMFREGLLSLGSVYAIITLMAGVAQLVRASDCGPNHRKFLGEV